MLLNTLIFTVQASLGKLITSTILFNFLFRWVDYKRQMRDMLRHSDHKGIEVRKPSGSLYTFPMPDCMCKEEAEAMPDQYTNTTTSL